MEEDLCARLRIWSDQLNPPLSPVRRLKTLEAFEKGGEDASSLSSSRLEDKPRVLAEGGEEFVFVLVDALPLKEPFNPPLT